MKTNTNIYLIPLFAFFLWNCDKNPPEAPKGMIYFKGGNIIIGSDKGLNNEYPPFETKVEPFFMDVHPVTVAQFREFVESTGYVTEAEKFGDAGSFNFEQSRWELTPDASWRFPRGPAYPPAEDDHPVTQVSWNDAKAYAKWAGKRLPSEFEWEFAAKHGNPASSKYSWGNKLYQEGKFKANVWQGSFPHYNDTLDGFALTSPVGYFGTNGNGLQDMGGNVWEWCGETYQLYKGNNSPFDHDIKNKVLRGGSFMCDSNVCHGYRVSARTFCSSETALFHTGFRCARDAL